MRFVNVREARNQLSRFLETDEEIVITRYGKPVRKLVAVTPMTLVDLSEEMGKAFREAGITKEQALKALSKARADLAKKRTPRRK